MSQWQKFHILIHTPRTVKGFLTGIFLCMSFVLSGCSSTPENEERVNPADTIADRMFFIQAPVPVRGESAKKPKPFFFKDCSLNSDNTYYSKTAYFCDQR